MTKHEFIERMAGGVIVRGFRFPLLNMRPPKFDLGRPPAPWCPVPFRRKPAASTEKAMGQN